MNGDQRRSTDANIRKVIGSYDDFILTALSSQNNNSVFIEKTQKEKKMLLAQFMGLEVFDKLWQTASEEIKDEVSLTSGHDYKTSSVTASSGKRRYSFFSQKDFAWLLDDLEEK